MLFSRAMASTFTIIVIGIPLPGIAQVAFGPHDPARGFDNPAPYEEVRRPARHDPSPQPEPIRPSSRQIPETTGIGVPAGISAQAFVSVPPEPRVSAFQPPVSRPVLNPFDELAASRAIRNLRSESAKLPALPEPPLAIVADLAPATEHVSKSIERALATHSMLDTPFTAEVDAHEAARRARQSAARASVARPVLLRAASVESDRLSTATSADSTPYYLWAGTFLLLAAGLLFMGCQVLGLILGRLLGRGDASSDGNISTGEPTGMRDMA